MQSQADLEIRTCQTEPAFGPVPKHQIKPPSIRPGGVSVTMLVVLASIATQESLSLQRHPS
jgi:hypothetical protein